MPALTVIVPSFAQAGPRGPVVIRAHGLLPRLCITCTIDSTPPCLVLQAVSITGGMNVMDFSLIVRCA